MPTPREIDRERRIETAQRSVCEQLARIAKKRLKNGRGLDGISVRVSPTSSQYASGKATTPCGFEFGSSDSEDAYREAARILSQETGCRVSWADGGRYPKLLRFDTGSARMACALHGVQIPMPQKPCAQLLELAETDGWPGRWARTKIGEGAGALEDANGLAGALLAYSKMDKPLWPRALSIAAFGDSKRFENEFSARFLAAAAQAGACKEGADAWAALGFKTKPSFARICGDLRIETEPGGIDLGRYGADGIALPASALASATGFPGLRCALVVENLTNYVETAECLPRGVLSIYGGGQFNEAVSALLDALARLAPAAPVLVWSDIDLGGFRIAQRVLDACPSARPFLMGPEELGRYPLETLRQQPAGAKYFAECEAWELAHPASRLVASSRECRRIERTLEQECMLDGHAQERIAAL